MPFSPSDFSLLAQGMGVFVLVSALVTGVSFARKWGWRFRFVGVTLFSVVLTVGLFALSLAPITRTAVAGAVPYALVYDRFTAEATIALPPTVTLPQVEATLRQAASNLFSPGRNGQGKEHLTIRARTLLHVADGVSQPVYLGQVRRSLRRRDDPDLSITLFTDRFTPEGQVRNPETAALTSLLSQS
ncbi:MAG: DUF2518 family protein [Oscillatoriales cyanobacterium SM2_2_1]|nr:DUF2518 family protein [Oscillatoriales cyanobacterium SM2_2_1]